MEYLVGVCLALAVSVFAAFVGLDRDRAFYPTVMIVIALYYCLFAVMGGSTRALLVECAGMAAFTGIAVLGFRRNLWWVAAALFAHGIFDAVHGSLVRNDGVPPWWPMFCMAYDVMAAACLAWLLMRARIAARVP